MKTEPSESQDRELVELLHQLPAPEAAPGFYDQAIARAAYTGTRRQRRRWLITGFGAAVAATATLWVVAGLLFGTPELPRDETIPNVTMTLERFASASALDSAMLTVSLPDGVELEGFPGQREITWETSLSEGKNLLPLTLVALTPAGGELLAMLEHENRDRTFRLRITVAEVPPEGTSG